MTCSGSATGHFVSGHSTAVRRFGASGRCQCCNGWHTCVTGPVWEGWIEPPAYTGKPRLSCRHHRQSRRWRRDVHITLRLYGDVGALGVLKPCQGSTEEFRAQQTDHNRVLDPRRRIVDCRPAVRRGNSCCSKTAPTEAEWTVEADAQGEMSAFYATADALASLRVQQLN
jgi:hypothetical protein